MQRGLWCLRGQDTAAPALVSHSQLRHAHSLTNQDLFKKYKHRNNPGSLTPEPLWFPVRPQVPKERLNHCDYLAEAASEGGLLRENCRALVPSTVLQGKLAEGTFCSGQGR